MRERTSVEKLNDTIYILGNVTNIEVDVGLLFANIIVAFLSFHNFINYMYAKT